MEHTVTDLIFLADIIGKYNSTYFLLNGKYRDNAGLWQIVPKYSNPVYNINLYERRLIEKCELDPLRKIGDPFFPVDLVDKYCQEAPLSISDDDYNLKLYHLMDHSGFLDHIKKSK